MRKTWVFVADRSRARIFSIAKPKGPLTELEDLVHPEARAHERDLTSDRPGRSPDQQRARHGAQRARQQAHEFAREIAATTREGPRRMANWNDSIVVAAPDVLGMLRKTMSGNSGETGRRWKSTKTSRNESPADIRKLLPEYL